MPKILIAQSDKHKLIRRAATSSQNLKALIKTRVDRDAEDTSYTVVTLNTKMKLRTVCDLINRPLKKLMESEDIQATERYTVNTENGRIKITPLKGE